VGFPDSVGFGQIPADLNVVGDKPMSFGLVNRHVRRNRARGVPKDKLWTTLVFFPKPRNEGRTGSLEINMVDLDLVSKGWIVGQHSLHTSTSRAEKRSGSFVGKVRFQEIQSILHDISSLSLFFDD
jgi:hypothetical protein